MCGAVALFASACASGGAVPRPFPTPGPPAGTSSPGRVASGALLDTALSLRGIPYRNGGSDPSGFDCSGFTQWVFSRHGILLPRETREQFQAGRKVRVERVAPGDLIFFSTIAPGASHVGIVVDHDTFIHAPSSTGVVRIERIGAAYWSRRIVGARRLSD